MEKISRIVRGNARVAAADVKAASAARPGAPTFGRSVGESTSVAGPKTTTAERAVALHNGITEMKKATTEARMISQMADEFFMSRMRRPEESVAALPEAVSAPVGMAQNAEATDAGEPADELLDVPKGYTPRGSYIDVRA